MITCCGLHSDRVARLSGCKSEPRIVPVRGEYLVLNKNRTHLVNGNIYPVSASHEKVMSKGHVSIGS